LSDQYPPGDRRGCDRSESVEQRRELKRAAIGRIEGLAESNGPHPGHGSEHQRGSEHRAPVPNRQDRFADERHDDRAEQEHRAEGADHPSHLIACVQVTGDGEPHHRWRRGAQTPNEPSDQEDGEVWRKHRGQRADRVDPDACKEDGATAEAVGEHAIDQLSERHPDEVHGSGDRRTQAAFVEVEGDSEFVEGRERSVDTKGHQDADEGEEGDNRAL